MIYNISTAYFSYAYQTEKGEFHMNAKRIFALVMSVLMVFASFAAVMSVSAEEDKFAPTTEVQEQMYMGEQGAALGGYGPGKGFGAMVSVPEGKRLTQINFHALATYNNNNNLIEFKVYQWDTDYATSIKGPVLAVFTKRNQVDNAALDVVFPTNRNLTGDLLWVATYVSGDTQMTPWSASEGGVGTAMYFANGSESAAFCFSMTTADALTVEPATYTATFEATVTQYTVKFVNEDGTVLQSSEVAYGEVPAYTGETPTKAADAQYTYTFTGWSPAIATVTGDATYTAQFSTTVNKYTVTFYAEDGTTVLESKEWEYGQNPVYNNGQNPTKPATAEKSYTFAGWTPAVVTVSGNASYTATFTDATNNYTVTWYNEDGTTVLETATWAYGSVPSFTKPTPAKAADAENTYAFKEWVAMSGLDSDGKVTGDASFKASYPATKIDYSGTVSPEEGTMDNVTADGLGEVAEEINKNIVLTVKVEAADANDTEQTAIKGQAGSRTLEFLDITLKDDGGNSVEVPQSTVLEIAIPFTVGNKRNITVYRHHNGTAAAFTALNTKPDAGARTDATFYVDSANNCIYVYTNQFSTYAIGYTVPSSATAGSCTPTYANAVEKSENGTVQTNRSRASGGSTVTLSVIPDTGYALETLRVTAKNGKEVELTNKGDGKYTFKMPASKVTVKAAFAVENPFEDVSSDAYYYDAVLWAVEKGITTGFKEAEWEKMI